MNDAGLGSADSGVNDAGVNDAGPGSVDSGVNDAGVNDAGPGGPEGGYALNQVRTVLDVDLDLEGAPHLVLCSGLQFADAANPVDFTASYRQDGRLLAYEQTGVNEWSGVFVYEGEFLVSVEGNQYLYQRSFVYDAEGRLERMDLTDNGNIQGIRSYFYDDNDWLIRIEPSGPSVHGTTELEWFDDGRLARVTNETLDLGLETVTIEQTFEYDDEGRFVQRTVTGSPLTQLATLEYSYDDGDLVTISKAIGEPAEFVYDDVPTDIGLVAGPNSASGGQSEMFIRTGPQERPWRIYLGDHPSGLVEVFQEFYSAHRLAGEYSDR